MFNSSQTLILAALALVLAFAVPLKAQDRQQDYLAVHNRARRDVRVDDIKWDEEAAKYARSYTQQRKRDCRLIHSDSHGRYGENLAWSSGDMSGAAAVRLWVKEKPDYFHNNNTCRVGKQCGHYTQVVWRNSKRVGCAKVKCDNGRGTFVTCNYSPSGNVRGQRPY